MKKDDIVEECKRHGREYAKKFDYDIDAIAADLKKQETKLGLKVVHFEPKRRRQEPASV
jgi:hypothetical protein